MENNAIADTKRLEKGYVCIPFCTYVRQQQQTYYCYYTRMVDRADNEDIDVLLTLV